MSIANRIQTGLAAQLSHPRGRRGAVVGRMLNRGNRSIVTAAAGLVAAPGATVADIGFGGGLGLQLLLAGVGDGGRVHGVEISTTMIARARARHRRELDSGRLMLQHAPMSDLALPDRSLDAAMSVHTLYFMVDIEAALANVRRTLRPRGRLVLGLGDPAGMALMPVTRHGFRLRPISSVIESLTAVGFTLDDHRRVGDGEHAQHVLVVRSTDG